MTCLWLYSNGLLGREVENSTFPAEKMKKWKKRFDFVGSSMCWWGIIQAYYHGFFRLHLVFVGIYFSRITAIFCSRFIVFVWIEKENLLWNAQSQP